MTRTRTARALWFPLLALLAAACFPEPPVSLRTRMIEQEIAVDALEKALEAGGDDAVLVAEAERIQAVSRDEALDRFRERKALQPRLADFDRFRATYVEHSDALVEAARSGDRERVKALVVELRASCDACHAVFRPGL